MLFFLDMTQKIKPVISLLCGLQPQMKGEKEYFLVLSKFFFQLEKSEGNHLTVGLGLFLKSNIIFGRSFIDTQLIPQIFINCQI